MSEQDAVGRQEIEGEWYCPICDDFIHSQQVTYEEEHDRCGTRVEWWTPTTMEWISSLEDKLEASQREVERLRTAWLDDVLEWANGSWSVERAKAHIDGMCLRAALSEEQK